MKLVQDYTKPIKVPLDGVCSSYKDRIPPLEGELDKVLITAECLKKRIVALANEIAKDFKEIYAIVVLEGAKYFFNDLEKLLKERGLNVCYDEIKLSSYSKKESSGEVIIKKDIKADLLDKDVLIVEDIVDTGLTLNFLKDYLLNKKYVRDVKICALLDKPARRKVEIKLDYVGFIIPNEFVVGYGIDYEAHYRELPYIACIK